MKPILYLYRSCTSCRNAAAALDARGVAYETREYFREPFTRDELQQVLERSGMTPSGLVATRSTQWRKGGLAEMQLSDEELLEHMLREPRLIRRPILVTEDEVIVGFNKDRYGEVAARLA